MRELKVDKEFEEFIAPLSDKELERLEKSVLEEGIRDAICVWQDTIIDGHHRYKLAQKHNLEFETKDYDFKSKDQAKLWMIQNQLGRRNLNSAQAVELVITFKSEIQQQAQEDRMSKSPVFGDVNFVDKKEVDTTTRGRMTDMANNIAGLTGQDRIGHGTIWTQEKVREHFGKESKEYQDYLSGKVPLNKLKKVVDKQNKDDKIIERHKKQAALFKNTDNIQLHNADFYSWCMENVEPGTVDMILTDPPYPEEFLHVWSQLSEIGKRVLKPGGYLVAYSGQQFLLEVLDGLRSHLQYCWTLSLHHSQNTQVVHSRNAVCTWKPLLVFCKGDPEIRIESYWSPAFVFKNGPAGRMVPEAEQSVNKILNPDEAHLARLRKSVVDSVTPSYTGKEIVDLIMGDTRDKEFHEWGQGEAAVAYLMNYFTEPGNLVLEPFAGGGTTLSVASKLKRRCIGLEIDESCYLEAKANLGRLVLDK